MEEQRGEVKNWRAAGWEGPGQKQERVCKVQRWANAAFLPKDAQERSQNSADTSVKDPQVQYTDFGHIGRWGSGQVAVVHAAHPCFDQQVKEATRQECHFSCPWLQRRRWHPTGCWREARLSFPRDSQILDVGQHTQGQDSAEAAEFRLE